MCVYGEVARSYSKDGIFYILFDDHPGAFYMISYDRVWNEAVKGACVQMIGEVTKIGQNPIMSFGWKSDISLCP